VPGKRLKKKGVTNKQFDSCVAQVKKQRGVKNAFAICESSFQKSKGLRPKGA